MQRIGAVGLTISKWCKHDIKSLTTSSVELFLGHEDVCRPLCALSHAFKKLAWKFPLGKLWHLKNDQKTHQGKSGSPASQNMDGRNSRPPQCRNTTERLSCGQGWPNPSRRCCGLRVAPWLLSPSRTECPGWILNFSASFSSAVFVCLCPSLFAPAGVAVPSTSLAITAQRAQQQVCWAEGEQICPRRRCPRATATFHVTDAVGTLSQTTCTGWMTFTMLPVPSLTRISHEEDLPPKLHMNLCSRSLSVGTELLLQMGGANLLTPHCLLKCWWRCNLKVARSNNLHMNKFARSLQHDKCVQLTRNQTCGTSTVLNTL